MKEKRIRLVRGWSRYPSGTTLQVIDAGEIAAAGAHAVDRQRAQVLLESGCAAAVGGLHAAPDSGVHVAVTEDAGEASPTPRAKRTAKGKG